MPNRPRRTFVAKKGSSVTCTQRQAKGKSLSSTTVFTRQELALVEDRVSIPLFESKHSIAFPLLSGARTTTVRCSGCLHKSSSFQIIFGLVGFSNQDTCKTTTQLLSTQRFRCRKFVLARQQIDWCVCFRMIPFEIRKRTIYSSLRVHRGVSDASRAQPFPLIYFFGDFGKGTQRYSRIPN
jgi:hypothetical protein